MQSHIHSGGDVLAVTGPHALGAAVGMEPGVRCTFKFEAESALVEKQLEDEVRHDSDFPSEEDGDGDLDFSQDYNNNALEGVEDVATVDLYKTAICYCVWLFLFTQKFTHNLERSHSQEISTKTWAFTYYTINGSI